MRVLEIEYRNGATALLIPTEGQNPKKKYNGLHMGAVKKIVLHQGIFKKVIFERKEFKARVRA